MQRLLFIKACVLLGLFLLVSFAFFSLVAAEMRVFELQHQSARKLADLMIPLVSDNTRMAAHSNKLIVNTNPDELAEIAILVASFDKPRRLLRVTVDQGYADSFLEDNLSAAGQLRGSSAIVDFGGFESQGGSNIFINTDDSEMQLRGQVSQNRETRQTGQFVTVVEGSVASITVGREVPFARRFRSWWRRHPRFVETIEYRRIDTGFEVLPEIQNDTVDLAIRPFMTLQNAKRHDQIVFYDLTTRVRFPLGDWYELAGHMSLQDGLSREILAADRKFGHQSYKIRIRVDSAD